MQVMKFGGTSVANAENMSKVVDIVSKAVERDKTILVSSAISGCTDTLIQIGIRASERDESYKTLIDGLQKKHHDIIRELLPLEKHEEDGGQEDAYASGDRQRHDALMEHDDADDDRDNQLDRYKQRRVFRVDEVDAGLVEDRRDHAAVKRENASVKVGRKGKREREVSRCRRDRQDHDKCDDIDDEAERQLADVGKDAAFFQKKRIPRKAEPGKKSDQNAR